ncbi:hypothetical protein [Endozoicomonas sp. ALC020]|uniref:hypothetical protein n=1 Tax=unclassified Endozoicomonas TaxID=2644528 RepID=UPI003BAE737C
MNNKLYDLYEKHWFELFENLGDKNDFVNPFLIKVDPEKIKNSDLKVMIIGQETKGWDEENGVHKSIDKGIDLYDRFFIKEKFYDGYGRSAFWKGFRFIQKEFKTAFPNKNISFIWNNISKIGRAGTTGVTSRLRDIERKHFPVVQEELNIIKPDIVLFLTGPNRDGDIKFHFPDAKIAAADSTFSVRALARVQSEYLPKISIRTYHPSYYKGFNNNLKRRVSQLLTSAS